MYNYYLLLMSDDNNKIYGEVIRLYDIYDEYPDYAPGYLRIAVERRLVAAPTHKYVACVACNNESEAIALSEILKTFNISATEFNVSTCDMLANVKRIIDRRFKDV